jgi:hypothetical protein
MDVKADRCASAFLHFMRLAAKVAMGCTRPDANFDG